MPLDLNAPLRISEIFHSLQGEADTAGLATVFVRLTGCPMRCVYCDSAYAFSGGKKLTIAKILDFILGTEVDALIPEIKAQRALESQVARLQKIIDDNQERLDNEDLKPKTREYLENEIAKRQEQIRNLPELLTADEIVERLIK